MTFLADDYACRPGTVDPPRRPLACPREANSTHAIKSKVQTPPAHRKIVVYIATSADGHIARPDGDVEWLNLPMPKGGYGMSAFLRSIDTILWGRKTYDFAAKMGGLGVYGFG